LPDWEILCGLARFMGAKGFEFSRPEEIREEMSRAIPEFTERNIDARSPISSACEVDMRVRTNGAAVSMQTDSQLPFLFHATVVEHTHRGFPLSAWVEGAKMLFTEGMLDINEEDAKALQLLNGDSVLVSSASFEKTWPVRIVKNRPRGTLHTTLLDPVSAHPNPQPVSVRKADV
jgi:predicted molibdopterin-dependent oxidoreductase YjgC